MFERAILRKTGGLPQLDLGLLAETLLFYQETVLVLDAGTAARMADEVGLDTLSRLVSNGYCKISYNRNLLAAQTDTQNSIPVYSLVDFHMSGHINSPGKKWDEERELKEVFIRRGRDLTSAQRAASQIMKIAPIEKMILSGKPINLVDMGNQDLLDRDYIRKSAKISVESRIPGFVVPEHWRFITHAADEFGHFYIETNFDIAEINRRYQARVPNDSFNVASILADVFETRGDMVYASKYMGEIVTSPLRSNIMQAKFELLNWRRHASIKDIDIFQTVHLEGKSLREVINSGARSFEEFLDLLDEARKFKSWLKGANPEIGLLKEYHQAVTSTSWLEKLPTKGTRFALMTGAGVLLDALATGGVATFGAIALGTADTFLLDKFLGGWRPNHFVEQDLWQFLEEENCAD